MSFYTIDGRFVNKKNVVEGFFDNRIIEHATMAFDTQGVSNDTNSMEATANDSVMETTVKDDSMESPEVETTEAPEVETTEAPEVETTEAPEVETTEAPEVETTEAPEVETTEIPITDEMKEDKSMYMNFCINGKCVTGTELRKLNELYDKKCTN